LPALRRLQREQQSKSPFVFTSERGAPSSTAGFARIERAGTEARLAFKTHPYMLWHACGYATRGAGDVAMRRQPRTLWNSARPQLPRTASATPQMLMTAHGPAERWKCVRFTR
jgi:hypothetical protein